MKYLIFCFSALLLFSCSSTRVVKPLKAKEWMVGADLGGPIIDFAGTKIPVPFTSLSTAYGIDSMMTVFGGLHTTSMAFGNFQMDVGLLRDIFPAKGQRPGLSVAPVVNAIANFKEGDFRIYPELDINLHWNYSLRYKHFAYASLANWFDLAAKKAHNEPNTVHYVPNIALGHTFVTRKMRYTLEMRWLAPNASNQNITIGYNGIANRGSLACYFGVYRRF